MGDWGGVLEGAHEGPWAPREEVGILVMGVILIDHRIVSLFRLFIP